MGGTIGRSAPGSVPPSCQSASGDLSIADEVDIKKALWACYGELQNEMQDGFELTEVKCRQMPLGPHDWFFLHGYLVVSLEKVQGPQASLKKYCRIDWGVGGLVIEIQDAEEKCLRYAGELKNQLEAQKAYAVAAGVAAGAAATTTAVGAGVGYGVGLAGSSAGMTIGVGFAGAVSTTLEATLAGPALLGGGVYALGCVGVVGAVAGTCKVCDACSSFVKVKDRKIALQVLLRKLQGMAAKPLIYNVKTHNCNHVRDELYYTLIKEQVEYVATGEAPNPATIQLLSLTDGSLQLDQQAAS